MGDEGLVRVLLSASSSLTSIADLLRWTEDEGGRLLLQVGATSGLFPEASALLLAAFQIYVFLRLCPQSWTPSVLNCPARGQRSAAIRVSSSVWMMPSGSCL